MADVDLFQLKDEARADFFALKSDSQFYADAEEVIHVFRGHTCDTERRGRPTPDGKSPLELVLDASDGFIPVWEPNCTLRWRFQERSLIRYLYPEQIKAAIRNLMAQAIAAWGDAAPVRFKEDTEAWDFEIAVRDADQCSPMGCTLASAFFPDQGQHELVIYPLMFRQEPQEQLETMAHEIGHIFGLRHFFAVTRETAWPVQIFGEQREVSIMNYGDLSQLTDTDRADLKRFYELVWTGELKEINRVPIRPMKPFSTARS